MTKASGSRISFLVLLLCSAAVAGEAQIFNVVQNFNGIDGAFPVASLAQGEDGAFYSTTTTGGRTCRPQGCGTAFRMISDGTVRIVPFLGADGQDPMSGLTLATNQGFYGTTSSGGAYGQGAVFRITQKGVLTTLYSFCGHGPPCVDGAIPQAGLVQGFDGNFYGTTTYGGMGAACSTNGGCGTVFRITPTGQLTTAYNFCMQQNCADGESPLSGLVQGTDGSLYGTTAGGGNGNECEGSFCGTVFKITPTGDLTTLHTFSGFDGNTPVAGLVQANDGNFYGTTAIGAQCCGTAFKITSGGTLTTIYVFCLGGFPCADGNDPHGALIQATDGNLYGSTTAGGGEANDGTIFQITTEGVLTTLHTFDRNDGTSPVGALVQATSGKLYGTTYMGGNLGCNPSAGCGTVYSVDMGLGPFVTFIRAAGKVGQTGGILGQGFTGTTSVAINGIQANFTVVSDTFIRATVPPSATTGYVTVTTPTGVLTSNVPFRVIQ